MGINSVFGTADTLWGLPSGWKVPQQLRVLKINFPTDEALSSLSFPSGNRLQLLYIKWHLPHTPHSEPPTSLPASLFVNLDNLKMLHLHAPKIERLPQELASHARGLRAIALQYCYGLQELPTNLGSLTHLEAIVLQHCNSLRRLPDSITQLPGLQLLEITGRNAVLVETFNWQQNGWPEMPRITKWLNTTMTPILDSRKSRLYSVKFVASRAQVSM